MTTPSPESGTTQEQEYTSALVVALPSMSDPIQSVVDEEAGPPHVTLTFFGDSASLPEELLDAIRQCVSTAAMVTAPFEAAVGGTAQLGDDGATVLLLDSAELVGLRELLMSAAPVSAAMKNAEQYPSYIPHMTTNYSGEPPEVEVETPIKINAIALWVGEHKDVYMLTGDQSFEDLMSDGEDEHFLDDDSLLAAGIHGFDEKLHPRGKDGRFIKKFGLVKFLNNGMWDYGTVSGINQHPGSKDIDITVTPTDLFGNPTGKADTVLKPSQIYEAPKPKAKLKQPTLAKNNAQKIGPQAGSNPGGLYTIDDQKYYVKKAKTKKHGQNEELANALYSEAGTYVPQVHYMSDGNIYSQIVDGTDDMSTKINDPEWKKALQKDMVVDAWLGNWDVLGMTYDNVLTSKEEGVPVRIDNGGALLYRAQGSPKGSDFGSTVPELAAFKEGKKAKVFGDISQADEIDGAQRVLAISPERIEEMVAEAGLPKSLADTLKARRSYIAKHYGLNLPESVAPAGGQKGTTAPLVDAADLSANDGHSRSWFPMPLSQAVILAANGDTISMPDGTMVRKGMDENNDDAPLSDADAQVQMFALLQSAGDPNVKVWVKPNKKNGPISGPQNRPEHDTEYLASSLGAFSWQRGDTITMHGYTYDVQGLNTDTNTMLLRQQTTEGNDPKTPFLTSLSSLNGVMVTAHRWDPPPVEETTDEEATGVDWEAVSTAVGHESGLAPEASKAVQADLVDPLPESGDKPKVPKEPVKNEQQVVEPTAEAGLSAKGMVLGDGTGANPGDKVTSTVDGKTYNYVKKKGPYAVVTDDEGEDPDKELLKKASTLGQPGKAKVAVDTEQAKPLSANGVVPQVGMTATAKDGHSGEITMVSPDGKFVFILNSAGKKKRKSVGTVTIDAESQVTTEQPVVNLPVEEADDAAKALSDWGLVPGDQVAVNLGGDTGEWLTYMGADLDNVYLAASPTSEPFSYPKNTDLKFFYKPKDPNTEAPQWSPKPPEPKEYAPGSELVANGYIAPPDTKVIVTTIPSGKEFHWISEPGDGEKYYYIGDAGTKGGTPVSSNQLLVNKTNEYVVGKGLPDDPVVEEDKHESLPLPELPGGYVAPPGSHVIMSGDNDRMFVLTPENKVSDDPNVEQYIWLAPSGPGSLKYSKNEIEQEYEGIKNEWKVPDAEPETPSAPTESEAQAAWLDEVTHKPMPGTYIPPAGSTVLVVNANATGKQHWFVKQPGNDKYEIIDSADNYGSLDKYVTWNQSEMDQYFTVTDSWIQDTPKGVDIPKAPAAVGTLPTEIADAIDGGDYVRVVHYKPSSDAAGTYYFEKSDGSVDKISMWGKDHPLIPLDPSMTMDMVHKQMMGDPDPDSTFIDITPDAVTTTTVTQGPAGLDPDLVPYLPAKISELPEPLQVPVSEGYYSSVAYYKAGDEYPAYYYLAKPDGTLDQYSPSYASDGIESASSSATVDKILDAFKKQKNGAHPNAVLNDITPTADVPAMQESTENPPIESIAFVGHKLLPGETGAAMTWKTSASTYFVQTEIGGDWYEVIDDGKLDTSSSVTDADMKALVKNPDFTVQKHIPKAVDTGEPKTFGAYQAKPNDTVVTSDATNQVYVQQGSTGPFYLVANNGDLVTDNPIAETFMAKYVSGEMGNSQKYVVVQGHLNSTLSPAGQHLVTSGTDAPVEVSAANVTTPGLSDGALSKIDLFDGPLNPGESLVTSEHGYVYLKKTDGKYYEVHINGSTDTLGHSYQAKYLTPVEFGAPAPNLPTAEPKPDWVPGGYVGTDPVFQFVSGDTTLEMVQTGPNEYHTIFNDGDVGGSPYTMEKLTEYTWTVDKTWSPTGQPVATPVAAAKPEWIPESWGADWKAPLGSHVYHFKGNGEDYYYLSSDDGTTFIPILDDGSLDPNLEWEEYQLHDNNEIEVDSWDPSEMVVPEPAGTTPTAPEATPKPDWYPDNYTGDKPLVKVSYGDNDPIIMEVQPDGTYHQVSQTTGEPITWTTYTEEDLSFAGWVPTAPWSPGQTVPESKPEPPKPPEKVYPGSAKPTADEISAWGGELTKDGYIPTSGLYVSGKGPMTGKIVSVNKGAGKATVVDDVTGKKTVRLIKALSVNHSKTYQVYAAPPKKDVGPVPDDMPFPALPPKDALEAVHKDGKWRPLVMNNTSAIKMGEAFIQSVKTPSGKKVARVHFTLTDSQRAALLEKLASTPQAPEAPPELGDWDQSNISSDAVTVGLQIPMRLSSSTSKWKVDTTGVSEPTHKVVSVGEPDASGTRVVTLESLSTKEQVTSNFHTGYSVPMFEWNPNKPKPKPKPVSTSSGAKIGQAAAADGWKALSYGDYGIPGVNGGVNGTLKVEPGNSVAGNNAAFAWGNDGNLRKVGADGVVIDVIHPGSGTNSINGYTVITVPEGEDAQMKLQAALEDLGMPYEPLTQEGAKKAVRGMLNNILSLDLKDNYKHADDSPAGDAAMFSKFGTEVGVPDIGWHDVEVGTDENSGKVSYFWSQRVRDAIESKLKMGSIVRGADKYAPDIVASNIEFGAANTAYKNAGGMPGGKGHSASSDAGNLAGNGAFSTALGKSGYSHLTKTNPLYGKGGGYVVHSHPMNLFGRIQDYRFGPTTGYGKDAFGKGLGQGGNHIKHGLASGNVQDVYPGGGMGGETIGFIGVNNEQNRLDSIAEAKKKGFTHIAGRPIEDVIITKSKLAQKKWSDLPPMYIPPNTVPLMQIPEYYTKAAPAAGEVAV